MYLFVLIAYVVLAVSLQILAGNFPVSFMAFPVNLIFMLLWGLVVYWLYRDGRNSGFVRFMLSPAATVSSLSLFVAACLVLGFGVQDFSSSWVFVAVLLFLMTHLLFVLLRGWKMHGKIRWYFLFNHAGLLIALAAGFFGAPDQQTLRMPVYRDAMAEEAFLPDGRKTYFDDNEIIFKDFDVSYFDNGAPSAFVAYLSVDGTDVELKVNHPYRLSFSEQLYLTGYDTAKGNETEYCVLQVVRDPWRYFVFAGILMMLAGALLLFLKGPSCKDNQI